MPRRNHPTRTPQGIKARVEDTVARRAVRRAAEDSYRRGVERTFVLGRLTTLTFTDPSWEV
jgi:hypothetical protein